MKAGDFGEEEILFFLKIEQLCQVKHQRYSFTIHKKGALCSPV